MEEDHSGVLTTSSASEEHLSHRSSSHGSRHKKKNKSSKTKQHTEENTVTPNEQVVLNLLDTWNTHSKPEVSMALMKSKDAKFVFEDDICLTAEQMMQGFEVIFASFPDFHMANKHVKEVEPGVVLIEEQVVTGTHTGEPFTFANHEPIARTDKKVVLDPERVYVTVEDGKVAEWKMIALGTNVGIHGLYIGIGGDPFQQ